jgi:GDP-L-fucose synthase
MHSLRGQRVWIAGHRGMVGQALLRRLVGEGCDLITASRAELDLTRQVEVDRFVERKRPDIVVVAAARVGGILANRDFPADFLFDNAMIGMNVIGAAHRFGVERLLYLGSSCIYPREAVQPMNEDALLTGPLEPTNQPYAIAKIASLELVKSLRRQAGRDYVSAMPTNLYGPGDTFDIARGHVVPALIRRAHEAKVSGARELVVWGTGRALREFLHVDDCADALLLLLQRYSGDAPVNVGSGTEVAIRDLAKMICRIVGFEGDLVFDAAKPDGAPRKLLNSSKLRALGWRPRVALEQGLADAYRWFLAHEAKELVS